jgi:ElaB/YqjD/DUF883 family membrane-anchored ribosome-binding protein
MADKAESDARQDLTENLKAEIDILRADVASLSETIKELLENERRTLKAQLNTATDKVVQQGEQLAQAATDQFASTKKQLEESIVRNPIQAILIALGLGFLIGVLRR